MNILNLPEPQFLYRSLHLMLSICYVILRETTNNEIKVKFLWHLINVIMMQLVNKITLFEDLLYL